MLCDICHKHSATVHLTEIVNSKVMEMHICPACAKNKTQEMKEHFDISDFLGGLISEGNDSKKEEFNLECSFCGMSFNEFKKKGRLGCANCYEAFKKQLIPLLKRIHSAVRHVGKNPAAQPPDANNESKMRELKNRLAHAIELENYEEAAQIRDEISDFKKNTQK